MTIQELKDLLASGNFHHATYRDFGTVWEGLKIYAKARPGAGFRGYELAGAFGKANADLPEAERLVAGTGISVGAYGQG